MTTRFYLPMFICCILFAACTTQPEFPHEETLAKELMPLQGVTYPAGLEVKYPFLIVWNYKRTDSLFHIYDLNTYELKSVFGTIGHGPDEFVYPKLFDTQLSDVLITDIYKDDLTYWYSINEEGQPVFKGTKEPNYIEGVANAAFINDSLYVLDDSFMSPNLHLLTFSDELPRKSWQYGNPAIINRFIDPDFGRVYANNHRIVFSYGFKKQIDFMDIDLNLIKRVKFNYAPPAVITEENQSDVKHSYSSGYLGKRYFYALFNGALWKEYNNLSFRGAILEVFDLDGNPIIKYYFDGIPPSHFVVDEKTFTLYGNRRDGEPEDHLLVYKLKGLSQLGVKK